MSLVLCRNTLALFVLVLSTAAAAGLSERHGRLPLHFEENRGQAHKDVRFLARGPGYGLYLTASEAVLALRGTKPAVLRMALVGAKPDAQVSGVDELPGKANYFIGKDPSQWRSNVPTYAKVRYRELYPGIDLVYYGNQRQLEYDFVVAPGADPQHIGLRFDGADKLEIDANGDLVLHVAQGDVRVKKPVVYQEIDGVRRVIEGNYLIHDTNRARFQLASYDLDHPVVIDPVLLYATYLGGSATLGERSEGIAVDGIGNAYVAGWTYSADFPTTSQAYSPIPSSTTDNSSYSNAEAFVTKINAEGTGLVYSTYLGGAGADGAHGIAVDVAGNAYVAGITGSADFPTTAGAFQTTGLGGDAFVTKLDPAGSALVYSTYLGGTDSDGALALAIDTAGNAYISGTTSSAEFPTTPGAFQTEFVGLPPQGLTGPHHDAFVTKLNVAGSALVYSTFLGGSSNEWPIGIATDSEGGAYIAGLTTSQDFPTTLAALRRSISGDRDAFVTKIHPTGSTLVYSTYLGGSGDDRGAAIAVDRFGQAYVAGTTDSRDFPTTIGAKPVSESQDAFVTKLDVTGSGLIYSTYLGGSGLEGGNNIAVDKDGNAYITGWTSSLDFPITVGALDVTANGGFDAFVTVVDATGTRMLYSTYLGGDGPDPIHGAGPARGYDEGTVIAVDPDGNFYVTGIAESSNFPTTPMSFQPNYGGGWGDAFVAKFTPIVSLLAPLRRDAVRP